VTLERKYFHQTKRDGLSWSIPKRLYNIIGRNQSNTTIADVKIYNVKAGLHVSTLHAPWLSQSYMFRLYMLPGFHIIHFIFLHLLLLCLTFTFTHYTKRDEVTQEWRKLHNDIITA
jgi:hypothetical protein